MWCAQREMYSLGIEVMEEDPIKVKGGRSHGGQETVVKVIEGQVWQIKQIQGETQMQWMLAEEEREIGHITYVGNGAIWLGIIGKERKQK